MGPPRAAHEACLPSTRLTRPVRYASPRPISALHSCSLVEIKVVNHTTSIVAQWYSSPLRMRDDQVQISIPSSNSKRKKKKKAIITGTSDNYPSSLQEMQSSQKLMAFCPFVLYDRTLTSLKSKDVSLQHDDTRPE